MPRIHLRKKLSWVVAGAVGLGVLLSIAAYAPVDNTLETRRYRPRNLPAADIAEKVGTAYTTAKTTVNAEDNTLVILATAREHSGIRRQIEKLDARPPSVELKSSLKLFGPNNEEQLSARGTAQTIAGAPAGFNCRRREARLDVNFTTHVPRPSMAQRAWLRVAAQKTPPARVVVNCDISLTTPDGNRLVIKRPKLQATEGEMMKIGGDFPNGRHRFEIEFTPQVVPEPAMQESELMAE